MNKEEDVIAAYFDDCILPRGGVNLSASPDRIKKKALYRSPPRATMPSYLHGRDDIPKTLKNPEIKKKRNEDESSENSFLEIVDSASGKEDDYFEVEKILGKEMRNGKPYFLVKWWGYGEDQCTWEPLQHLKHAYEYVKKFERK